MSDKPIEVNRNEVRRLIADYMASEGCTCCQNTDVHEAVKASLGKLLKVPKYKDGSGYDFYKYRSGIKP